MDTALTQKNTFILDKNLTKANCTGNRVCTSCDIEVLALKLNIRIQMSLYLIVFLYKRDFRLWCMLMTIRDLMYMNVIGMG